eukprot:TRINITY_DN11474_c0_g1_i1.p1 TRINITY_DN11474_c0_g1~~TRINITY_DN11474_c0_g1_i1.p1  ORF type:complete len:261 (+),score=82.88 TRINITY_DN11474_c0_g1_i1:32-784(+)
MSQPPVDGLFNYATVSPDGILYQDDNIQIGFQTHFFKHQGRVVLSIGNYTDQPMNNINTLLMSKNVNPNPLHLAQQRPPAAIEPKKQIQHVVEVNCLSDFVDPPAIKIDYSLAGKPFTHIVKIPVSVLRFIQPNRITEQEFLKMWVEQPNPQNERVQVVDTGAPGNLAYAMQMFSEGFHLCVIPGKSWNQNNVVGSGLFHSNDGIIPVLVRMEISATTPLYRITVRSPTPILSTALLGIASTIFGRPASI